MPDLYKNKYRISSARAQWWDYGSNAAYFITICTKNREHFFGEIAGKQEMKLNEMGKIAQSCWLQIHDHFPFVELDAFVVMPNHTHGIIIINKTDDGNNHTNKRNDVETQNFASLPGPPPPPQQPQPQQQSSINKFGPQSKNLASIVRGFKIGVTKNAQLINKDFEWQSRFHDHIIRNDAEFNRIAFYIENNPANWQQDKFFNGL